MLKTPELAMPRSRKVTTFCNGRKEVWNEREDAQAYVLEIMMSTAGEEYDRGELQLLQIQYRRRPNQTQRQ